jgi:hypothetical protein
MEAPSGDSEAPSPSHRATLTGWLTALDSRGSVFASGDRRVALGGSLAPEVIDPALGPGSNLPLGQLTEAQRVQDGHLCPGFARMG